MKSVIARLAFSFVALLLFALAGGAGYYQFWKPAVAPPARIRVESTVARIMRGEYLFRLGDCDGCHSERDFSRFGGPVVPGRRGAGMVFPPEMGLPGRITAPNITPDPKTGIGSWSDGETIRAIREGIGRDGRPLFPMMPYEHYRHMSDSDVYSLVAFLKTLKPVRRAVPRSRVNFPVSVLMRTGPEPTGSVPEPDRANPVKYGEYLVTLAGCADCHTVENKGRPVPGREFAGGREFRFPFARVVAANITPDPDTGIGKWKEQDFVDRFYQYQDYVRNGSPTVGPEGFTLMPWLNLARMPRKDLQSIYAFLRAQPPVYNAVEIHPIAPPNSISVKANVPSGTGTPN